MSKRYKYGFVIMASLWCLALFSLRFNDTVTASNEVIDQASVSIPASCTFSGQGMNTHNATIANGTYLANIGATTMRTFCNDGSGYSIYAIGTSGGVDGTTDLIASVNGSTSPANNIVTGVSTSGALSNWAMKVSPVSGTYAPTITNGFGSYSAVPSSYTKVATFASATDSTIGSSITSTYAVYVSDTQVAGSYTGLVKYTMVHPAITGAEPANDVLRVEFYGSGLYFDANSTESVNTMVFRRICESSTCRYALDSGEYKAPIGAPSDSKWFFVDNRNSGIGITELPISGIDSDSIISMLGNDSYHGTRQVFYRNSNAIYGLFQVGPAPLVWQDVNIVAYQHNGSTLENVGGVYRQPANSVTWLAALFNNGSYNHIGAIGSSGQPIRSEADFIAAASQAFGQANLPGGSIIRLSVSWSDAVLFIDYQASAGGDAVTNMPQSPEQHSYSWVYNEYALSCTIPSRNGYTFIGWDYYSASGNHVIVQPCEFIYPDGNPAPGSTITVTAQWGDPIYIYYDHGQFVAPITEVSDFPVQTACTALYSNCEISDMTPIVTTDVEGCTIQFEGWRHNDDTTYQPGDYVYIEDFDITLEATWSYSGDC